VSGSQVFQGIALPDDLPTRVAGYVSAALAALGEWREAESLLWRAQATDPDCLHVYYLLYKLYFNRKRLTDADHAACMALDTAARLAGISSDWHLLDRASCDWGSVASPQHFYLFSLKALAFIRLRHERVAEAHEIIAKLREIDPQDTVGASVIESYAMGAAA
jgi:tetratricopeptide (TPR) repeat protein